jgi:hypothetical protein
MKSKTAQSLAELNTEAWGILVKELGVVKTIRFLGQFDSGSGNYATDRVTAAGLALLAAIFFESS